MQIAHAWLKTNELGDLARVQNITPAQAVILRTQFGVVVEGDSRPISPLEHLHIQSEGVSRNSHEEYSRLAKIYGTEYMKKAFPGESPVMPETFAEVGFEETDEKEPKKGKPQVTVPLDKLPRGDNGADMVNDATEKRLAELEAENTKLRLAALEAKAASANGEAQ